MRTKLKDLVPESIKSHSSDSNAKTLFREFVTRATSEEYRHDSFWDTLRQQITPNKYKTVSDMFDRWHVLAKTKKVK